MRKHRGALITVMFTALLIGLFLLPEQKPTIPHRGAPAKWTSFVQRHTPWPGILIPPDLLNGQQIAALQHPVVVPPVVVAAPVIPMPAPIHLSAPVPPVSPTSTGPTSPTSTTTAPPAASGGDAYAEWSLVASCEEGGTALAKELGPWFSSGSAYPNSIGIMASAWSAHGGGSDVSEAVQVAVGESLINSLVGSVIQGTVVYSGFVPDQHFCAAW